MNRLRVGVGVLRDLSARGLQAPKLAIGDGALGFWAALGDIYPSTHEQRCWVHKAANVVNYLPRHLQPRANAGLREILDGRNPCASRARL